MEDSDLATVYYVKTKKDLLKIFQELESFYVVHRFSQVSPLLDVEKISIGP